MKKYLDIKYVVKVLQITRGGQKIHFTIRHPENARCLTGVAMTTSNASLRHIDASPKPTVCGTLALAIADKGDVFYTDGLRIDVNDVRDYVEGIQSGYAFSKGDHGRAGTRMGYFETCIPICSALMEGYYEDTNTRGGGGGGKRLASLGGGFETGGYTVTLYLRYQLKEKP
jgi:hypothetical protein